MTEQVSRNLHNLAKSSFFGEGLSTESPTTSWIGVYQNINWLFLAYSVAAVRVLSSTAHFDRNSMPDF